MKITGTLISIMAGSKLIYVNPKLPPKMRRDALGDCASQAIEFVGRMQKPPAAALDAGSQVTGSARRRLLGDDPHRGGLG